VPVAEQRHQDLQGFFQAVHPVIEGHPERPVLRFVPASADTQDQPPLAHLVGGRRHLRQDRRIAERVAHHQRADLNLPCRLGQRSQHCPALPHSDRRLAGVAVQEMVGEPDAAATSTPR